MQPPNVLPEPRSYLGTAITIGVFTGPAFGIISGLVLNYLLPWPPHLLVLTCVAGGAFYGIIFGLSMAAMFRGETVTVSTESEIAFLRRLDVATAEVSYFPEFRAASYYVYKPSLQAGWLAGRISVAVGEGMATIVGPKLYVGRLLKRLQEGAPVAA